MPSDRMTRSISAALALTLLTAIAVSAQIEFGPTLRTAVVTSELDPAAANDLVYDAARERHEFFGGRVEGNKNNPSGWLPSDAQPSRAAVSEEVLEIAGSDEGADVIVISGGDGALNASAAETFRNTIFIDLGQTAPCLTPSGEIDPTGACEGSEIVGLSNYSAIDFAVEDGAYLAGLLAAAASRDDSLGIISGSDDCAQCNRYVHGFVTGARSFDPDIDIALAYLADDEVNGFGNPGSAATFTRAFLDVHRPDVFLPVGRASTEAMVEAACESEGVLVVGAGMDLAAERPDLTPCVLTSVTIDLETAVTESMTDWLEGMLQGVVRYDLGQPGQPGGVAVGFPDQATLPVETRERFDTALAGIQAGEIETCAEDCAEPIDLDAGAEEE